jgi:hypothetical protein
MNTQLHVAYGIVAGRARSDQDRALWRNVELARLADRRGRRAARREGR